MKCLGRAIAAAIRDFPELVVERVDRWILRQHSPFDVVGDGTGPVLCCLCGTDWPCEEFVTTDRRIDERINGAPTS